jgi:uncharacterized damage-inducible protein DinB
MFRSLRIIAAAALLATAAAPALAHDGEHADAAAAMGTTGVKGDMLSWISDAEGKLIELAEATPEGKYSWSPGKGVRTTGEVFMHVAAANYGLPSFWGVAPPAGFDFNGYENSLTKKADIQKALKDSFAHMKASLEAATDEDMEKSISLMGNTMTVRSAYFLLLSHAHEHL